jgi:ATP-dependent protease ClpP protease subunit
MPYWGEAYRLHLTDTVDDNWVDWVRAAVAIRDRPVEITMNSEGGWIVDALACAHQLQKHRAATVATIGPAGRCFSAAVFVFMACSERRAHISSTFLVHDVAAAGNPERWTAAAHRRFASSLESLDRSLISMLATRCGRPVSAIEAIAGETPISAMTAQSIGPVREVEW